MTLASGWRWVQLLATVRGGAAVFWSLQASIDLTHYVFEFFLVRRMTNIPCVLPQSSSYTSFIVHLLLTLPPEIPLRRKDS